MQRALGRPPHRGHRAARVPTAGSRCAPGVVEHLLEVARDHGHVVVDTGFSLEDDPAATSSPGPGRNQLTLAALDVADEVLVVGTADPVGLVAARPRRWSSSASAAPAHPVRVVVNRMRSTLGWSERDIAGMVEGFARLAGVHFLPDDRAAADRALVDRPHPRRPISATPSCGRARRGRGRRARRRTAATSRPPARDGSAQDENSRYSPPTVKTIIASSSGSWPVSWCFFGSILIARSWAAITPTHVADHDRDAPWCRPGTSGGRRASRAPTRSPVPKRLLPLLSGSLAWIRVWVPISTK